MSQRYYSSTAQPMSLTGAVSPTDLSVQVNTLAGAPSSTPFTLVIDAGSQAEEIITVTATAGTTLTVVRGEDGTAAQGHLSGASVRHMMTARDLREPQAHINSTTGVHGLGASDAVVGTATVQTLTNKAMSGTGNTFTNIPQAAVTGLVTALASGTAADAAEAAARTAADAAAVVARDAALASLVPAGTIVMTARATAPAGWSFCDGTEVNRTAEATLFAAIGTQYGTGNGSTTFNKPNFKGRVPVGLDASQTEFNALGKADGEKTHTLTVAEMPSHSHTQDPHAHTQALGGPLITVAAATGTGVAGTLNNSATTSVAAQNNNTGGGGAHNNLQPYIAVNYIIKH